QGQPDRVDRAVRGGARLPRAVRAREGAMAGAVRLEIEPHATPSARKVARAAEVLHEGGLVAYPTDTVYALGCAIDARRAVERIYRARRMDQSQRLALI